MSHRLISSAIKHREEGRQAGILKNPLEAF
jgi:hypothetical protein